MEQDNNLQNAGETQEEVKFDDLHGEVLTDRVKVLSPGRTILKRFFRSKLSVVGLVILIALMLISFIGPLLSPWGEQEVDRTPCDIVTVERIEYVVDGEIGRAHV